MAKKTYTKEEVMDIAQRVAETIVDRFCDVQVYSDTIEKIIEKEMK